MKTDNKIAVMFKKETRLIEIGSFRRKETTTLATVFLNGEEILNAQSVSRRRVSVIYDLISLLISSQEKYAKDVYLYLMGRYCDVS